MFEAEGYSKPFERIVAGHVQNGIDALRVNQESPVRLRPSCAFMNQPAVEFDGPNMHNDFQHFLKLGMYRQASAKLANVVQILNALCADSRFDTILGHERGGRWNSTESLPPPTQRR